MDPPESKLPGFAVIELHDATLDALHWQPGGEVTLVFGHVAVYFPAGTGRSQVWGCRVSLEAVEVTRLEIRGTITDKDWVSDGEVWDQFDNLVDLESLGIEQAISKMDLSFTNGSTVVLHARRAKFVDISRTEQLEEWIGPLNDN